MHSAREFGNELLTRLLTYTVEQVPGAVGAGLSIASDGDRMGAVPHSVAAVGAAEQLDPAQWRQGIGPIWEAFRSGRLVLRPEPAASALPQVGPVFGTDAAPRVGRVSSTDERAAEQHLHDGAHDEADATPLAALGLQALADVAPDVWKEVAGAAFLSGEWGGELPVVLSVYLDRPPDRGALEAIDRHETLVSQALAVVEYCAGEEMLAEQMLQMNQYRRVIEQAKGLVIGATGTDANGAFAVLARASQHFNVRLRNLAVALVEHVSGAEAEHPDDPSLVIDPTHVDRATAVKVWAALNATAILASSGDVDPALDHTGTGSIPRIDG